MGKFLVTGGCGFIGSHLCERLTHHGHKVTVLDNLSSGKKENLDLDSCELVVGSVTDSELVNALIKNVDACFHLAAIPSVTLSNVEWLKTNQVNLIGTINIFNAIQQHHPLKKIPVIYASSAAVYGNNASLPLNEHAKLSPLSAYGADKCASELHARVAWLVYNIPNIGFRLFNVFGPRQDPQSPYSGVISIFNQKIMQGETIKIYGDGKQTRDFIYIDDVVNFFVESIKRPFSSANVYNVCRGSTISINQLAKVLAKIYEKPLNIEYLPARASDIKHSCGDPSLANYELNLSATISLQDGLIKMKSLG